MRSHRILIVDDDADTTESLGVLLTQLGHETHLATTGKEALGLAAFVRPDVIFLDIDMPQPDGVEVCRMIRQQPWGKNIVIAVVTGWTNDKHRDAAHGAGCDYYLVKPVDSKRLVDLLQGREESHAG